MWKFWNFKNNSIRTEIQKFLIKTQKNNYLKFDVDPQEVLFETGPLALQQLLSNWSLDPQGRRQRVKTATKRPFSLATPQLDNATYHLGINIT